MEDSAWREKQKSIEEALSHDGLVPEEDSAFMPPHTAQSEQEHKESRTSPIVETDRGTDKDAGLRQGGCEDDYGADSTRTLPGSTAPDVRNTESWTDLDPLPGEDPNFAAQTLTSPMWRDIALSLREAEKAVADQCRDSIPPSTLEKKPSGSEAPSNLDNDEDESHDVKAPSPESRSTPESSPRKYGMAPSTRSALHPKATRMPNLSQSLRLSLKKVSSPIPKSRGNKRTGSGASRTHTSPEKVPVPPASCVRGRAVNEPADAEGFQILKRWTGGFLYKRPKIREGGYKWVKWVESENSHEAALRNGDKIWI